jgi:hypothetical protein
LLEWLSSSLFRVEAKSLQHCIYARSEGISAFAIETLEVTVVLGKDLRSGRLTYLRKHVGLVSQRAFEREKIGKFTSSGLPYGFCTTEVAMLFEESQTKAGLPRDRSFARLLRSSNQPEKRCLSASVPAEDCPALSLTNGEGYSLKYPRRAELYAGVRDCYLRQVRRTLEHAARQRSTDSTV